MAKNLKDLALAKMSGFRHSTTVVPEWEGVTVILREPSAEAWLRWQDISKKDNGETPMSLSEKAKQNLQADVALFIDILCDEEQQRVFTPEDAGEVELIYGPVHSRLLKQALDLITSAESAKKK